MSALPPKADIRKRAAKGQDYSVPAYLIVSWGWLSCRWRSRNWWTSSDPATPGYRDEGFGRGGTRDQEQL